VWVLPCCSDQRRFVGGRRLSRDFEGLSWRRGGIGVVYKHFKNKVMKGGIELWRGDIKAYRTERARNKVTSDDSIFNSSTESCIPSVKSIETRLAPASKQPLISFSH